MLPNKSMNVLIPSSMLKQQMNLKKSNFLKQYN